MHQHYFEIESYPTQRFETYYVRHYYQGCTGTSMLQQRAERCCCFDENTRKMCLENELIFLLITRPKPAVELLKEDRGGQSLARRLWAECGRIELRFVKFS